MTYHLLLGHSVSVSNLGVLHSHRAPCNHFHRYFNFWQGKKVRTHHLTNWFLLFNEIWEIASITCCLNPFQCALLIWLKIQVSKLKLIVLLLTFNFSKKCFILIFYCCFFLCTLSFLNQLCANSDNNFVEDFKYFILSCSLSSNSQQRAWYHANNWMLQKYISISAWRPV